MEGGTMDGKNFQLEQLQKLNRVELKILVYLSNGKRSKDIAGFFRCQVNVVDQKIHKMRDLTGAATTTSLVAMAIRNKIID